MMRAAAIVLVCVLSAGAAAQTLQEVPRLSGNAPPTQPVKAPPVAAVVTNDVRQMRSYPEQPPVIPHAIDG
jgi:cytochrome c-type protein NapB